MKKINLILVLIGITFIILLSFFVYKIRSVENKSKQIVNQNLSIELKKDPKILMLIKELSASNSLEVFNSFDDLAKKEVDYRKKIALKFYAASSLMSLDVNKGAKYYIDISNDLSNPNLTRAYAMTQVYQRYLANADPELLKFFYTDYDKEAKSMIEEDIKIDINKKILDIYPFGLSAARIGILEISKNPNKENAKLLREKYLPIINSSIESFSKSEELRHLVPNTYLNSAKFLVKLEKFGSSDEKEVRSYFDNAYSQSIVQKDNITRQFIMLEYSDYLLSKNLNKDAENVISQFLSDKQDDVIKNNLKITKSKSFPNLLSYLKSNNSDVSVKFSLFLNALYEK